GYPNARSRHFELGKRGSNAGYRVFVEHERGAYAGGVSLSLRGGLPFDPSCPKPAEVGQAVQVTDDHVAHREAAFAAVADGPFRPAAGRPGDIEHGARL